MAYDKKVLINICRTEIGRGHDFVSVIVGMVKVPTPSLEPYFIAEYKVMCSCCGATPEETAVDLRPTRMSKKKKLAMAAAEALE